MTRKLTQTVALLTIFSICSSNALSAVFGVKSCGSSPPICGQVASTVPANLFMFTRDGSSFTNIGPIQQEGVNIDVDALALSPSHGLLGFEVIGSGSRLISIDPTSASATIVGQELPNRDIRGAAFDGADGLWVVDSEANELLRIEPSTGDLVGTPTSLILNGQSFDLTTGTDLAFVGADEAIMTDQNRLFGLSISSGELTEILVENTIEPGTTASAFYSGIVLGNGTDLSDIFVYDVNGFDDIYQYDSTLSRSVLFENILSEFNAGRGDLAAVVPIPAAIWFFITALIGLAGFLRKA